LASTQLRAAPIPRILSVVELTVLRVPKDTIVLIYECSESAFTSFIIPAISGSRSIVVWAWVRIKDPAAKAVRIILFIYLFALSTNFSISFNYANY
jgi:hypothetical protein